MMSDRTSPTDQVWCCADSKASIGASSGNSMLAVVRPAVRVYGRTKFGSFRDTDEGVFIAPHECYVARRDDLTTPPTRSTRIAISYPTCPMSHDVEASAARCDPSPTRISSRYPCFISTTDCST